VVSEGYRLSFETRPPLTVTPVGSRFHLAGDQLSAALLAINTLVAKNAVVELSTPVPTPGFYSPVFLVSKKDTTEMRLIIDLKVLNRQFLQSPPHFRMESIRSLRSSIRPGDWMYSLDLRDAYLHVPMHPASWRYLRFALNGRHFEFRVLPFGISVAPWVFNRITAPVLSYLHCCRIRLHGYLDDFLGPGQPRLELLRQRDFTILVFQQLGFLLHPVKSELTPTQCLRYLGAVFDTERCLVLPPVDRVASVRASILRFRTGHHSLRQWMSLLGSLSSLQDLTPGAAWSSAPCSGG